MHLQDLSNFLDIDIAESLEERFMDDEAFYLRFLRKLLTTQDFALLEQKIAAEDWQEALRRAHNLKGVCANLGLTTLSKSFAALVTLLRSESFTADEASASFARIVPLWKEALNCIAQVKD